MDPAAEIKGWTGEIVAVAGAKDAELEGGKQSNLNGAREIDGCAGGV